MFAAIATSGCADVEPYDDEAPDVEAPDVDSPDVDSVEQAITGSDRATDSNTTPQFSAVVRVRTATGSCTGTVIGPRHVLTAKQCGKGVAIDIDTPVGLGTGPAERRSYPVANTIPHPDSAVDVEILELARQINTSAPPGAPTYGVRPLALNPSFVGTASAKAVGFGESKRTASGGCDYSSDGRRRWLQHNGGFTVTDSQITRASIHCAAAGFRGMDPGDGGGPLVDASNRVVGIFSWFGGPGTIWTRINANVARWINAYTARDYSKRYAWAATTTSLAGGLTQSFNSSGFTNTVSRSALGRYTVVFPSVAGGGGNVQVTALGAGAERCKVVGWSGTQDIAVQVACHNGTSAADARFIVSYHQGNDPGAYLWASNSSSTVPYDTTAYSYNSTGALNRVARAGRGTYSVTLRGMNSASIEGGNPMVTAYGDNAVHCKVNYWSESAADILVAVNCFDGTGAAADSNFTLSFTDSRVPTPFGWGAYAWANNATAPSYQPDPYYSYSSSRGLSGISPAQAEPVAGKVANTIGQYTMRYPYQVASEGGTKSATHVNAYGPGNAYCKVESWAAPDVTVKVKCFNGTGSPLNTQYTNRFLYSGARLF